MTTNGHIGCSARRRGFTLAEALMAVTVLGIAAAGVLLPFAGGARVRAEGVHKTLGVKLASDLMEEILIKPFHDPDGTDYSPGPDAGEVDFGDFDNVDDFHDYSELQGQVKDAAGNTYANFSRNVTCVYRAMSPQPAPGSLAECDFISVTVQVDYSGRPIATINRLVSE